MPYTLAQEKSTRRQLKVAMPTTRNPKRIRRMKSHRRRKRTSNQQSPSQTLEESHHRRNNLTWSKFHIWCHEVVQHSRRQARRTRRSSAIPSTTWPCWPHLCKSSRLTSKRWLITRMNTWWKMVQTPTPSTLDQRNHIMNSEACWTNKQIKRITHSKSSDKIRCIKINKVAQKIEEENQRVHLLVHRLTNRIKYQ